MSYQFRPAQRHAVKLLIGVAGGTGSGKTLSAMKLAQGLAGDKEFAVIDSEAMRALHYAPVDPANPQPGEFRFQHLDLQPPFSPDNYLAAIQHAESAGFPVVVVDSISHEWQGDGGLLEMAEAELTRLAGGDWKKRQSMAMASWIKPKQSHKKMVSKLLQLRCHLILCFRAEEKLEMVKNPKTGKTEIQPKKSVTGYDGWQPVCEKNLPYELTMSFMMTADAPGVPKPIKLQEQHRALFDLSKPISEQSGKLLGEWSQGGTNPGPTVEEMRTASDLKKLAELAELAKSALPGSRKALRDAYLKRKHELETTQVDSDSYGEESQDQAPSQGDEF